MAITVKFDHGEEWEVPALCIWAFRKILFVDSSARLGFIGRNRSSSFTDATVKEYLIEHEMDLKDNGLFVIFIN